MCFLRAGPVYPLLWLLGLKPLQDAPLKARRAPTAWSSGKEAAYSHLILSDLPRVPRKRPSPPRPDVPCSFAAGHWAFPYPDKNFNMVSNDIVCYVVVLYC